MRTEVVAFFCAALVSSALVPVIIRFARRHGLFDHISSTRKVHSARVPRLGGVAIVAGFYAPLLGLIRISNSWGCATAETSKVPTPISQTHSFAR